MSDLERFEAIDDVDEAKAYLRMLAVENERLRVRLQQLTKELAELKGGDGTQQLSLELDRLQEQIAKLNQKMFGDSSERRPAEEPEKPRKPKKGHGPREQPKLEQVELRMTLADDDRTCPTCGEHMRELSGVSEDSEFIDVIERRHVVAKMQRQKYSCDCGIYTPPAPTRHLPGGRYSLKFAVHVALAKYLDHAPLNRQARIMGREGLRIDSQTLWDQIDALAKHLVPSYEKLRDFILGGDVVGADETWWRLMGKNGKPSSSKKWWAWSMTSPGAVWHGIAPSRSADAARSYLGAFDGTLVVDGYKAYDTLAKENANLTLAHCWAHARRKFVEAEPNYSQCSEALDLIGKLFDIDRETPNPAELDGDAKVLAAEQRLKARKEKAPPILEKLRAWALAQRGLPKSGLRKAIDYMLKYWNGLNVFVHDPFVPLDNNATERALRGLVIGRKNHYGSRSKRGTEVAALFYSLLETAAMADVDPVEYLTAVSQCTEQKGASPSRHTASSPLQPHSLSHGSPTSAPMNAAVNR